MTHPYLGQKYRMGLAPVDVPDCPWGTRLARARRSVREVAALQVMDARFEPDRVPALPEGAWPRLPADSLDDGPLASVRLLGPYTPPGGGPQGFQFLVYHRINRAEALAAAWAFYGAGAVEIAYLAAGDVLLAREVGPFTR